MKINETALFLIYTFLIVLFSIYSYALLDPNLTLTSLSWFLSFQEKMRRFGLLEPAKSTLIFVFLVPAIYGFYWFIAGKAKNIVSSKNIVVITAIVSGLVLVASYPSFSHDIFNYIFNAKMVLVYHANPHYQAAVDFMADPMLGFMHNVHTPAPYWYVWTAISLIPAVFTLNQIFPSMLIFKAFSLLQFFGCYWLFVKIWPLVGIKKTRVRSVLFLLNPLILIEAIGVGHNDLSMMFLVLWSFYLLLRYKNSKKWFFLLGSLGLLLLSGGTKYATLTLFPFFLLYIFMGFDIGLCGAVVLFLLPFIRIEQLHSWYLIWPLTWIFLSKNKHALNFFIFLSFFALMRYAPYIYYGNWNSPVPTQRLLIYLFIPGIVLFSDIIWQGWKLLRPKHSK